MSKMSNKLVKLFLLLILITLSYVIYISFDIYLYGDVNELKKADAAIVLGAGVYEDEPSPVFKERINHSIWLYENGYVDKLLFTGGKGENEEFSESSIAKNYAIEHSIPEKDILIVSDPLHMKRAMLMARDSGLAAYSSPTPTTRFRTIKSKLLFLEREVFYYIGYEIYRLIP